MARPLPSSPLDLYRYLLEANDEVHVELIDGEVVVHAHPGIIHSFGCSGLGAEIYFAYQRARGGPGGWWILDEVDIELIAAKQAYRPDIAGWRKERVPKVPTERPVKIVPDWICETLSPSNAGWDLGPKRSGYHKARVHWYWVLDPEHQVLTAYEWESSAYRVAGVVTDKEPGSLAPFDAVRIDMAELFPIGTE
jgi:Uma2 family endonuclease